VNVGVFAHPVRLACTGNPSGPSLYHLLEVIGKEKAMGGLRRRWQTLLVSDETRHE
jgi:anticodon-binding protein